MTDEQYRKKRLLHARLQTALLLLLLAALCVGGFAAARSLGSIERRMTLTEEKLQSLDMAEVERIASSLDGVA